MRPVGGFQGTHQAHKKASRKTGWLLFKDFRSGLHASIVRPAKIHERETRESKGEKNDRGGFWNRRSIQRYDPERTGVIARICSSAIATARATRSKEEDPRLSRVAWLTVRPNAVQRIRKTIRICIKTRTGMRIVRITDEKLELSGHGADKTQSCVSLNTELSGSTPRGNPSRTPVVSVNDNPLIVTMCLVAAMARSAWSSLVWKSIT